MKTAIYLLFLFCIYLSGCEKNIDEDKCKECLCFDWIAPIRLSYQNDYNEDLIRNKHTVIDSILGYKIVGQYPNFEISQEYLHLEFDIRDWVGMPEIKFKYAFIEILSSFAAPIQNTDSRYMGIGKDHEFYVFTNLGIDTINIRWDILLTTMEGCCNDCVSFPTTYIKCNGIEFSEGTLSGAVVIRK